MPLQVGRLARASLASLALALSLGAGGGGVFERSAHGDPARGALRAAELPIGDCAQCHVTHGAPGVRYEYALFAPNDNGLCASGECHGGSRTVGREGGVAAPFDLAGYQVSSHGRSVEVWPGLGGPGRAPGEGGRCLNCHAPHGEADRAGLIPALALAREEALCLACHDGAPASDVASDFSKPFRHPLGVSGMHRAVEDSTGVGVGPPSRRHAECTDCHNPHMAAARAYPAGSGGVVPASGRLAGVAGVTAEPAVAGAPRRAQQIPPTARGFHPAQPGVGTEHQLCYRCHSSWTTLPPGKPDLARLLNPANLSFHPVEARGRDPSIRPGAFAPPWTATSTVRCTDCHGGDGGLPGVHGSRHRSILVAPFTPGLGPSAPTKEELCFRCHRHETYAGGAPTRATGRAPVGAGAPLGGPGGEPLAESRWNPPATAGGHSLHSSRGIPCGACHAAHGAPDLAHLIVLRPGGISSFSEKGGARCSSACHGERSYEVNYGR